MMNPTKNLKIRKATFDDAKACAKIHQQEIATGFLSQLGMHFLGRLYTAMVTSQHALCIVIEDEKEQVAGFISGCFHVSKFYKEFFLKHSLKAFFILLPQMMKLSVLRKIFETVKYPFTLANTSKVVEEDSLPDAEILSMAVEQHVRGIGLSQNLVAAFFDECRNREIKTIKTVIWTENIRANRFFCEKLGFKLHSNISVHESEMSNVYIKTLC